MRQHLRRLAREQLAVGAHFVGLGVHLDPRLPVVVDHVLLADPARVLHRHQRAREARGRAAPGLPSAACDTNVTEVRSARPYAPNIGR